MRALDTSYIQVAPAPASGRYWDVTSIYESLTGDDTLAAAAEGDAQQAAIRAGSMAMALLQVRDATASRPLALYSSEAAVMAQWWPVPALVPAYQSNTRIGSEQFVLNAPILLGMVTLTSRADQAAEYSASAYDALWAPVQDRSLALTVDYFERVPGEEPSPGDGGGGTPQPPVDTGLIVIGQNGWCVARDVELLTGETYGASTVPDRTSVDLHIKSGFGWIATRLNAIGETVLLTDTDAVLALNAVNANWAASRISAARGDLERAEMYMALSFRMMNELYPEGTERSLDFRSRANRIRGGFEPADAY